MRTGLLCAPMLCIACLAASPSEAFTMRSGHAGGSLRGSISNAARHRVESNIVVPDSFVILDVKFCYDRILVAAWVEHEFTTRDGTTGLEFLSEFWQFAATDTTRRDITFADRKVLLSRASTYGESTTTYAYSISCAEATAVYEAGWEWGTVRVFDRTGAALPDIRDAVAAACACNPEYIWPIVWTGVDRKPALVLSVTDGGLGPYYVRYDPASGEATGLPAAEITGALLDHILNSVLYQWP